MKHFMLDVETFGVKNHSIIISLGAVWFDPNEQGAIKERFYVTIDPEASERRGFRMNASTMLWWLAPERRAVWDAWKGVLHFEPELALLGFGEWLTSLDQQDLSSSVKDRQAYDPRNHRVFWANGPDFDCVLLQQYYETLNMEAPWNFRNNRCFRTMKNLPIASSVCPPFNGIAHNAVDDAEQQARWLQNILHAYAITV